MKPIQLFFSVLVALLFIMTPVAKADSSIAPDSTQRGPHPVASGEYRFPATLDPEVLDDKKTEVWAKIFYPQDIKNIPEKSPLIMMLHGQHNTCGTGNNPRLDHNNEYADFGTCPPDYVITPNHEGYNYLAENLASWGYWVVSINTNRGINASDHWVSDNKLARGKMVLKHLSLLYQWSTKGGAPGSIGLGESGLIGKIDFANVGLFGHSNGGQGVRSAYYLYQEPGNIWTNKIPGLSIKGIFEIGGADFPVEYPNETSRLFLDADGTAWSQLVPMCDGEIPELGGRMPFERMMLNMKETPNAQKSLYEVWGANHDFFNTEWQTTDAYECPRPPGTDPVKIIFNPRSTGSIEQQTIALASVPAFFRSHVGQHIDSSLNRNFNPLFALPAKVTAITQVDRDFTPSPAESEIAIVDDFDKETGINSSGNQNIARQIQIKHQLLDSQYEEEHRTKQRMAVISWLSPGIDTFFEAILAKPNDGRDIRGFATLDFRIARTDITLNPYPVTDFSIQLEDANGKLSNPMLVSEFAMINGPVAYTDTYTDDGQPLAYYYIPILKTVRIPLSAFYGVDFNKIHGVRFTFDKTTSGSIYLTNIRFHRNIGFGS